MNKFFAFFVVLFVCTTITANEKLKWALYDVPRGTGSFHDGLACFYDSRTQKYGYINSAGEVVIKAQFIEAKDFEDGQAIVTTDTGNGIINRTGSYLLKPEYSKISRERETSNLYIIEDEKGQKGVFFNSRLVIPPVKVEGYYSTYMFPFVNNINLLDGEIYSEVQSHGNHVRSGKIRKNNETRTIYFDGRTGKEIDISSFIKNSKGLIIFKKNEKHGIKNADTQKVILEPEYQFITDFWFRDYLIAYKEDINTNSVRSYLIDANGKILIEADMIMETDNENYVVSATQSEGYRYLYALHSITGETILPAKYDLIYNVTGDWYWYRNDNESAIINLKTKKEYMADSFSCSDDMIRAQTAELTSYFINAKTGERIPGIYDLSYEFSEGLAVVRRKGEEEMVIDKQGHTVLSSKDGISIGGFNFSEGVIGVYYNGRYGFVYNPTGYNNHYVYDAKQADRRFMEIWHQEGMEAMKKERYTEAKEIFYRIMMNNPNDGSAINNYGICLEKMGFMEEAHEAFAMAYDLNPDNSVAKEKMESTEAYIAQKKAQIVEKKQSGTFWDALASFGSLLGQMSGSYSEYYVENSFISDYAVMSNSESSGSSSRGNASLYSVQYNKWESLAERHFHSITACGYGGKDKNGNIKGDAFSSMSRSNYAQMKKAFREAQRQMRNIRYKAQKEGVNIPESKWETASISY